MESKPSGDVVFSHRAACIARRAVQPAAGDVSGFFSRVAELVSGDEVSCAKKQFNEDSANEADLVADHRRAAAL